MKNPGSPEGAGFRSKVKARRMPAFTLKASGVLWALGLLGGVGVLGFVGFRGLGVLGFRAWRLGLWGSRD